ncbi:MAG: MFS transporter [Pirellulaceae bacterium]|nr:MFS transporter [Pirellulaceae bacterium]
MTDARGLTSASFVGLAITQLLTAVNDNVFRWLAIGIGKDYVRPENVSNILMAGTACFVLPYLVLAAPAGYLADRFSKRSVIVGCKIAEVVIMALGVVAIAMPASHLVNLTCLFLVVALMGAQSALFSPSKLGIIPELLPAEKISAANGLFGLVTVSATVIGMAVGSWLSGATGLYGKERWWISAVVLVGIAGVGLAASLAIRHTPVADPGRRFPWLAAQQTWRDLRTLASNPALLRVTLGVVFFWSIGALAQLNVDQFAFEGGALHETDKVPLLMALVIGVGLGSVLAGVWSGGHVELGILPLGALGVAVGSMLLFTSAGEILEPGEGLTFGLVWALGLLFLLGTSAGLFAVPLDAYMQHRSPPRERGAVLAAMNFLVFLGILLAALLFAGLRRPTFPGSLENIAAARESMGRLDEPQRAAVAQLAADLRAAWQAAPPAAAAAPVPAAEGGIAAGTAAEGQAQARPDLRVYVERVDPAARQAAIAQLLWVELQERRRRGEFFTKEEYFRRFEQVQEQQLVSDVYYQASDLPLFTARQIFLLAGIGTIPVFFYIVLLIPQASVRFLVWLASHTVYSIRVWGRSNLPERGGALLVANHVSLLDGILLLLTSSRPVRILAVVGGVRARRVRWLARLAGVILVAPGAKEISAALQAAREALQRGELVGMFPEGGMTRTGMLQAFRPGLMKVLDGIAVPVIPVYLDELWGSIFSYHGGRVFWKWPRHWRYPISIHFGPPVEGPQEIHRVRQAVQHLGATAVQQRSQNMPYVPGEFVRSCKRQKFRTKVADSLGAQLTGGTLLMRTLILRRLLRREVLADDETQVGVLLPPSVPAVVVNAALSIDRRVAVNLNYTVSQDIMDACIRQAGIRHVLTSRRLLERFDFKFDVDVVMLEDLRDHVRLADKLTAALATFVVPARAIIRRLNLHTIRGSDLMTVIFTSGSTGEPKGVMLSHGNVASNVEAVWNVVQLRPTDVLLGILPFFHSFGYTITLWTVLSLEVKGVYHYNPLEARVIGKLCQEQGVTILLATPTFLRSYLRRCEADELKQVDVVVTGAEKLPKDVADAFEAKFGVRPVEGYGCTETSPLAAVNVPPSRCREVSANSCREGTVGRPIPGVAAKVIHLETGEDLPAGQSGMLLIKGPNIMQGYMGLPGLTAEVVRDGWYVTGDVAQIDEDGFIQITGRESRFSKIGGEMVPHIQIEETLARVIGNIEDGLKAAVTAVPDPRKGERLVVLHTELPRSPAELCQGLADAGLPNLYIPSPDSFVKVDQLPLLGSGKLDLKRIKEMAAEQFAGKRGTAT